MSNVQKFVKKITTLGVALSTIAWSVGVSLAPVAVQAASCPDSVSGGTLIKVSGKPAIYAVDSNMKYRYFENGDVFKTWNSDESYSKYYVTVSQACFDSLALPAQGPFHVFPRSGSGIYKYLSSDQLYVMEPAGVLAKIDAASAKALYGNYTAKTIGLSEWSFYKTTGADVTSAKVHPGMLVSNGGKTWYVDASNNLREVTATGFTANRFKTAFVHAVSDSAVAGLSKGSVLDAYDATVSDRLMGGTGSGTPATGGAVSVSLAADNPAGGILASGTAFNPVLKVNLTAGSKAASVTGLKIRKGGFVANSSISGVEVVDAQGVRHGNIASSLTADNDVTVLFAGNPITIAAGSTQTVTVRINLASTATSGTLVMSLLDASSVISDGSVSGSFPVMGNTFSLQDGSTAVATVVLDAQPVNASGATLNVDAVNVQEIAKFSLQETTSREDVWVKKLSVYNNGTAADTDVKDVQLVAQDGTVLATAQQVSKTVTFDLSAAPYKLGKGETKYFTVRAKIVDGASRTIQFTVYNDYDVVLSGASTNAGILATAAGSNDTSFPVGDATNYNKVTIGSGSLSFNKDASSPSSAVAPATSGVVLAKYYVKPTGEDMELRKVTLAITSSTGSLLSGSFTIKVNGSSVYSAAPSSVAISSGSPTTLTLSTYPVLMANQNSYITVEANIASGAANAGTIQAYLDLTQVKRLVTNDIQDPSVNQAAGNVITVQAAALKVTNLATPVAQSVVAGSTNVELANIELNAGTVSSGEDVRVTSIIVSQKTSGTVTDIGNLVMYDATGAALATTASTATGAASTTFTFTSPILVPKNGSVVLKLKGDVLTRTDGNTHTFSVADAAAHVASVGKDTGNNVTETGGIGAGQAMTIASAGTLTLSLVSGNNAAPSNDQTVAVGATNVPVFAVRLTAQNEPIKVTSLTLMASGTLNTTNDLMNLKLYKDNDTQPFATANQMTVSSAGSTTSTVFTWTATDNLLPAAVQPGTPVTIYVKADVGPAGQVVLGDKFNFQINTTGDVVAKGASSGTSATVSGTPTVTGISYVVPFSVSVVADAPAAGSSQTQAVLAGTQLARVKITNNGSSKITVNGIKFTNSGSTGSTTTTYKLYYSDQNSTNYVQNTASSTMGSVDFTNLSTQGSTFTIDGGSYRYVTVAINTLGSAVAGDTWQLSVASVGDVKYVAAESDLGYDSNNSGSLSGNSGTLYADGKPTMGTIVKQ